MIFGNDGNIDCFKQSMENNLTNNDNSLIKILEYRRPAGVPS